MAHNKSEIPPPSPAPTVAIVSLGCPKNLVDSEVMAGYLSRAGFTFTNDPKAAGVIIVNTCSFIGPAVEEAKAALGEMVRLKKRGKCQALICTGCLPQKEGKSLEAEFPEVDAFMGIDEIPEIAQVAGRLLAGKAKTPTRVHLPTYLYDDTSPRLLSTPPWTAYLKIAEGCHHRCSFCTIPAIRGRLRSRQPDSIIREAENLADRGVKEIVLIAQDSTAYGRDTGTNLASLLSRLDKIEGLHWIRLMYSFPGAISDSLLEAVAASKKICHYLDLPLQHAHPRILRLMHRPGSGDKYLEMIARLRSAVAEIALRSSFIVGFPGETEGEFQALLDFLTEAQLDRVGAFVYCREPGTVAAALENQVPAEIAQERYQRLMLLQREICRGRNSLWVGKKMEVLVERPEKRRFAGRSFRDAPEIDGEVLLERLPKNPSPRPGEFVLAEITAASEYDLLGRVLAASVGSAGEGSTLRSAKG